MILGRADRWPLGVAGQISLTVRYRCFRGEKGIGALIWTDEKDWTFGNELNSSISSLKFY